LLFITGVIAVYVYHIWAGATGGLDPERMAREGSGPVTIASPAIFYFLHWMISPALLLIPAGIIVGAIRAGARGTQAGFRYACGSVQSQYLPDASRFLAICARVMTWGGILVDFAACGFLEIMAYRVFILKNAMDPNVYFELIWSAMPWATYAPLTGIILGRIIFGGLSEGARIRSGTRELPAFSRLQDFILLCLFTIPWYLLWFMTREYY